MKLPIDFLVHVKNTRCKCIDVAIRMVKHSFYDTITHLKPLIQKTTHMKVINKDLILTRVTPSFEIKPE